jgi:hypothetical protein
MEIACHVNEYTAYYENPLYLKINHVVCGNVYTLPLWTKIYGQPFRDLLLRVCNVVASSSE